MENQEKLYTVEEIAEMTSVTSRTIRNYLKKGLLKGRKVGGLWRFTKNDVEALFNNSTFINKVSDTNKQHVFDFLNNKYFDNSRTANACTLVNYHCNSQLKSLELFNAIMPYLSDKRDTSGGNRIFYEYLENISMARYTIFCDIKSMSEIVNIINSKIDDWN